MLDVRNLTVCYGSQTIVKDISFSLRTGQWLMIVGPNGAGKSTIVKAISRGVPYKGEIAFEGKSIDGFKPSTLARNIGVLAQNHHVGYGFTVEEVVRLGRYAYSRGVFGAFSDEDEKKVEEALSFTGMTLYRSHSVLTLSGGELQRTFLAQLFAQDPRLLILDEPTNHLDLVYQKQTFEMIREWSKKEGRGVISVVHDLSLAKAYGTHAVLLDKGSVISCGEISTVLTQKNLKSVYEMDVHQWMQEMLSQWEI